jgi:antitoxin component YwqK of YwqJK toxin-antitoxin module
MRCLFLFFVTIFLSFNAFGQNIRLVFDQYYVDRSDFDGEYMSFYDLNRVKNDYNAHLALETFVRYHENGTIAEMGRIVKNKPEGVWKKWDEDGNLIARIKYKDGLKVGKFVTWDAEGNVVAKGSYNKNGERKGIWKYTAIAQDETQRRSFNY